MNPQNVSSSFLIATGHIRAMRGGAQSHMLTASDGHTYVVKFANNPQSVRVLANEWIASSIGRALGLTIPEPAILYVPASLVESSPSLVIRLSSSTLKCSHGLAFGSRVISGDEAFDYLPESLFERIENRQEFVGAYAWTNGCATVTVGRLYSAAENRTEASVFISSTSAIASMPESGVSRTLHYAAFMRERPSISMSADGSRSSPG
jgi:hypothetical protein